MSCHVHDAWLGLRICAAVAAAPTSYACHMQSHTPPSPRSTTVAADARARHCRLRALGNARFHAGALILLNRPSERAENALKRLQKEAGDPERVTQVACDLQSFASVRNAAQEVDRIVGSLGLDVLANNAGAIDGHQLPYVMLCRCRHPQWRL